MVTKAKSYEAYLRVLYMLTHKKMTILCKSKSEKVLTHELAPKISCFEMLNKISNTRNVLTQAELAPFILIFDII